MMDKTVVAPYISAMAPVPTRLSPKGNLRKPLQCLLCDIYGTLFISGSGELALAKKMGVLPDAIVELMTRYGIDTPPSVLLQSLYDTIQAAHQQASAEGADYPEIQIERIWSKILPFKASEKVRAFAVEFEMVMNPVWPMPGLRGLIKTCHEYGIHLGIISNAQFFTAYLFEWFLGKDLQSLGFDPHLTFYSYLHGRAKPSRFLYQLAVENLHLIGIPANHVAYIGNDIRNDIAPARDVGFQTVLFAGDARSLRLREDDPTCQNVDADLRITHLNQLASHIIRNN